MLSALRAESYLILRAAPPGGCNYYSDFTDQKTRALRKMSHFPTSRSQMVAEPGTWNQFCLTWSWFSFCTTGLFSFYAFFASLPGCTSSRNQVNLEHKNLLSWSILGRVWESLSFMTQRHKEWPNWPLEISSSYTALQSTWFVQSQSISGSPTNLLLQRSAVLGSLIES